MELGKQTFQMCVACHGPDGKGIKAGDLIMAPSLPESAFVKGKHRDLIAAAVLKGILKEDNKYVQAMLPLGSLLNDEQIAALITYVMEEFGGKKDITRPTEVGKWRKQFNEQQSPFKRKDLENLLKAANAPELISDLRYSIYSGKWGKLPDFSTLKPTKKGIIKNNRISLDPAKKIKEGFGLVFEATMTVPKTEVYEFSLGSDDGSALAIDGEGLIDNDGVHPAKIVSAKEKLEAGEHTIKVLYFDRSGQRSLSLAIKTNSLGEIFLSKEKSKKGGGKKGYKPILLSTRNPGEAIVHRAFLPDAKPRSIGVGYPGKVNLCWDADTLNLAYIWRGDFMDVATLWNGRGSASKPIGQDRVKTAQGLPFQILESLDEPWQPFSEAKIKYERDSANPQKEITFNVRHPDYQFLGYRLDKKRFPTFRYRYQDISVTDFYTPEKIDGIQSVVRTIKTEGQPAKNTYLRIANTGPLSDEEGWHDAGQNLKIRIENSDTMIRQVKGQNELLISISGTSELRVIYRWETPLTQSK